ncbi:uroporphyrinogen decarboxylase family protein [Methanolobus sp. ZRKC3]|uniref:uroporphyrinogen decarboxylase family protein n=1 Tax=Methanolobus sp. ZRKC3 TaxID=3125786 RepID=UPI003250F327
MTDDMNSKERFVNALEGKEVDRMPLGYLWFGAGDAVLEKMGASLNDVYRSAKGMAEAQILAREMYHHDNVMAPWGCLLVEAEALGTKLDFRENEYPKIVEYPMESSGEFENLDPDIMRRSERVQTVAESISIMKKELNDEAFIACATLTPLMLVSQLMGGTKMCTEMLMDPDNFRSLLDVLTESCIVFADIMLDAGADGIFAENGESTAELFSHDMAEEFGVGYTKKVYSHVQDNGGYVISHNCAALAFHDLELKLKPNALNFAFGDVKKLGTEYGVECQKLHNHNNVGCKQRYCFKDFQNFQDEGICLMGNINPYVFSSDSPADIEYEVDSCMNAAPEKGFILASGCEIPLSIPSEKMDVMWKAMETRF